MYELTYIISPLLEKVDIEATADKVRQIIVGLGGEIKKSELGQKQKLSYPIKKQVFGYYAAGEFNLEPEKIAELEKELRANNDILRYLLIAKEELKALPAKLPKIKPQKIAPAKPLDAKEIKAEKVKIEELDKKLEEILKE